MKRIISGLVLIFISACSPKQEKPIVTIQKFSMQKIQMNEVVKKLMTEKNIKTMYAMADGIESTRAVDCSPIGEECNLYYQLINKMVNVTRDGELNPEERNLLIQMKANYDKEIQNSEQKLKSQWKDFFNQK